MFKYSAIGFVLHRKCSASCDICCFSSSPESEECLDVDNVRRLIEESNQYPDIRSISFTGGEIFLDIDKLSMLVEVANSCGKKATCVTNGFWATGYSSTVEKLKGLQSLGLKVLHVSCDEFHLKYIPIENINNILLACQEINMPVAVNILILNESDASDTIRRFDSRLANLSLQISSCLPVGLAESKYPYGCFKRTLTPEHRFCPYDGIISVSYDGSVYPCFSQFVRDTALSLGNFIELSLSDIFSKIKNNALLYLLRNGSMDFFIGISRKLDINVPERITSPCELCSLFFSSKNIVRFLPYVREEMHRRGLA